MSSTWGRHIRLSLFGESHGPGIGVVIDGLPPGVTLDWEAIRANMLRRAPGRDDTATPRREADEPRVLSGLQNGTTTGAPLCALIENTDTRSQDYQTHLPRPGHADWTAYIKYGGYADMRGGGHFSGRLTAPLVFAGSIAAQILAARNIFAGARISRIHTVADPSVWEPTQDSFRQLARKPLPVLDDQAAEKMRESIRAAKGMGDSVGGVIEAAVTGLPGGLGDPFFDSMESVIASFLFSIPAIKGVEFGDGFGLTAMTGSEANDEMEVHGGGIRALTNHNGCILGGITNGMPLIVRVAVKPTASIAGEQRTVDLNTMENAVLRVSGRHDPCIVPRAVPVVEAALCLCILDVLKGSDRL